MVTLPSPPPPAPASTSCRLRRARYDALRRYRSATTASELAGFGCLAGVRLVRITELATPALDPLGQNFGRCAIRLGERAVAVAGPLRNIRSKHSRASTTRAPVRLRTPHQAPPLRNGSTTVELPWFGGGFTAFEFIPLTAPSTHTPWGTGSRGPNGGGAGCTSPQWSRGPHACLPTDLAEGERGVYWHPWSE